MKKLALFLILCLVLILLISCGKSTSDSSSITNCTTSGSPSSVLPSSSTKPQDTKAPITSTAKATETQPISTSETTESDPTVINSGFLIGSGFMPCPLHIDYEMPKSCPLSAETVSITLYFGLEESFLTLEYVKPEDSFDITLGWGADILYRYRSVTATEIEKEKYFITCQDKIISYSHSETIELPLSIFSENAGNLEWCSSFMKQGETWDGSLSINLSYQKNDDGTIVFYPHYLPLSKQ